MSAALGKYTVYTRPASSAVLDQDADLVYLRLQRWVDAECRGGRNPTAQVGDLLSVDARGGMLLVPLMGMQNFDTGHLVARLRGVFGGDADLRLKETSTSGIEATLIVPRRLPQAPVVARRAWWWRVFLLDPVTATAVALAVTTLAWLGVTRGVEEVALLRLVRDALVAVGRRWNDIVRSE